MVNFGASPKWIRGIVAEVLGSANFNVRLADGRVVHRHWDQMAPYYAETEKKCEPEQCEEVEGPSSATA